MIRQPAFIVTTLVLLLSAVTLNAATRYLQLHFKKEPVSLQRPLDTVPSKLGPWVQVSVDEPLDHETQDALQTDKYIFRDYVDTRRVTAQQLREFDGKSMQERRMLLRKLQHDDPQSSLSMAVTYYTGMVDTVAHIPERRYIADGFEPRDVSTTSWTVFHDRDSGNDISLRFLTFEDQTLAGRDTKDVAYFFHTNGKYEGDPIGVRQELADLFQKYGYYSKIELMAQVRDGEAAKAMMSDFLAAALPEVERCWPDWQKVTSGK